jgi:NADH:ubiquinone oxidoreductase subunit C
MTTAFAVKDLAVTLAESYPRKVEALSGEPCWCAVCAAGRLPVPARHRRLKFDYFNFVTAVDYYQYFELVYRISSLQYNHVMVVKVRTPGREDQVVPSVTGIWQGADFQEREIFDLFGIGFEGHPDLRRIFLWEGYKGFPLRMIYLVTNEQRSR